MLNRLYSTETFEDFAIGVLLHMSFELALFYFILLIYHFFFFKRKLSNEVEAAKERREKLVSISRVKAAEPENLSPTQQESLIEADKTQKSEKNSGNLQQNHRNQLELKKKKRKKQNVLMADNTQSDQSVSSIRPLTTQSSKSINDTIVPHSYHCHSENETLRRSLTISSTRDSEPTVFSKMESDADMKTAKECWFP